MFDFLLSVHAFHKTTGACIKHRFIADFYRRFLSPIFVADLSLVFTAGFYRWFLIAGF